MSRQVVLKDMNGGTSAKFSLEGGTHPYSNALYWVPLGGRASVSHFPFDLWIYIDNGQATQALEFDVNQTFGSTRWTWGSECNVDTEGSGTSGTMLEMSGRRPVCPRFPSNTWIHLIWTLERVGNQVHSITLPVGDQTFKINTYFTAQSNWFADEIDIASQMDGNFEP